ncbi:Thioredoxin-like protein cxxs1 [Ancistrocladus abbreviatus]
MPIQISQAVHKLNSNIIFSVNKEEEEEEEMKGSRGNIKSRVVKIDSEKSWEFFITQANKQSCPIVVHFSAAWCMPSVAMNSLFEELALSYQDILFLLVDVDELKKIARKMEVKAMPTFFMMKNGALVDKLVGANPGEIRKRINGFVQPIPLQA